MGRIYEDHFQENYVVSIVSSHSWHVACSHAHFWTSRFFPNDVRERGIRAAGLSHMVHWVHCCRCGSNRPVSFPATSFISATCPDFVYKKLPSPDVVQLALLSHGRAGSFLSPISNDSILLRAGADHQFHALLPIGHIDPDPSRNYEVLEK